MSCHTEAKRKGGLLIDSQESLVKGGDSGPAIAIGKAKESFLIDSLYPDDDNHMPPKGQLKPQEIAALEKWIDDGAKWDVERWAKLNLPSRIEVVTGPLSELYRPIFAMALSPDSKQLAVGRGNVIDWYRVMPSGDEKTLGIRLEFRATSATHNDSVQSLAFSPDGKMLASGAFRSVRFWNSDAPEKPITEVEAPFIGRQTALCFLADGERILVADSIPSQLGRLHEIVIDSGKITSFDTAHRDSIFTITRSADGKRYATTSADKLINVRDSMTHKIVARLEGHTGYVLAAVFSPEGKRIASGGDEGEVKVWNVDSSEKIASFSSRRSGPLYSLAWTTNREASKRKEAEKDPEKAAEINTDLILSTPASGRISAFTELKDHQGQESSTGAKEKAFDKVETPLYCFALDSENLWSFGGGEDGRLYLWNDQGKLVQTVEPEKAAPPAANAVATAENQAKK